MWTWHAAGEQAAEPGLSLRSRDLVLGEVGDLEQADGLAHRPAFLADRLEHLKGLKSLEHLGLSPSWRTNVVITKITDAGLEHLKGLTKLRALYLGQTNVTDLGPIKRLTNLQILSLGRSNVSACRAPDSQRR